MDIQELISLYFLDMLNPQQAEQLANWLKSDPSHLEQFVDEAIVQSSLLQLMNAKEIRQNISEQCDNSRIDSLLKELAEHERSAQAVQITPAPESPELISNVRERKQQLRSSRHVSRLSLYTSLIGVAAMLFAVVYVMMNPRQATQPTATIIESRSARWSRQDVKGHRLFNTDPPLHLQEGMVKIRLDDGAEVLIQAPARFHAESSNQLYLEFGKLTSKVPPSAKGFVVRTPAASIVDYGTEFGVLVDHSGRTEAHVFDGEIELRSGPDPIRHGGAKRLLGGWAGIVTDQGRLEASPQSAQETFFIRDLARIDPETFTGLQIDLADIVGGGNGFGTGTQHTGIDLRTGKIRKELDDTVNRNQRAELGFVQAPQLAFVDSVFVPGLDGRPTQVASTGLTSDMFATTSGRFWGYLFKGAFHEGAGPDPTPRHALVLDGRNLDEPDVSVLSVHSNMGITFDIQQIRRSQPFHKPARFRARIGLSQTGSEYHTYNPSAQFWVLLDGDVRLRQALRMSDGGREIDVPLDTSVRFLSLAVSEHTDGASRDWGIFVEPRLELIAIAEEERK